MLLLLEQEKTDGAAYNDLCIMTATPNTPDAKRQSWYRRLPRWTRYAIPGVVILVLLLVWWLRRGTGVTLTPVVVGEAVTAVYAPGTVLSSTETVVAATAAGRVTALTVVLGSQVAPGQVVARIDDTQARLQLEEAQQRLRVAEAQYAQVREAGDVYDVRQAQAQLQQAQAQYQQALSAVNAARANLRSAQAQVRQARSAITTASERVQTARQSVRVQQQQRNVAARQVTVARAQLTTAQTNLTDAQDFLQRQEALFAEGAVSERRVIEARTRVAAAEAAVTEAQARIDSAEQGVTQTEAAVDVARGQVSEADSAVETARAQLGQAEAAVSAAEAQVAEAQAQAAAARQQITAAQARLAQTQRGARSSAVEVASAQVDEAQAGVAQAQQSLADYTVRSLVSGTVSATPVDVGDFVALGSPVADVVSSGQLYVQADVDESDIGPIVVGQTAYFTTDSVPNLSYQGMVTEIGPSASATTNTYPVEIRNLPTTQGLRVNMTVDVNIVTRVNPNALLVPTAALVLEPRPHVWLVNDKSRLVYRDVTVGARDVTGARVQLTSGVRAGNMVVTNPQDTFKDGQHVRVNR